MKTLVNSHYFWQYFALALILAATSLFYFHSLGKDYITLWDEAVHVNVVKNLANDCCAPKLHLTDIGIDFQDWTNNYHWVHKPLAPLFLQAVFYKLGGETLFAFRLSSVLFALMSIAALFFVGRKHFGFIVGVISASLLAFNPFIFELVKGRQFSGLHDLCFLFFGILALDRVLRIVDFEKRTSQRTDLWESPRGPSSGNWLLFGLFAGFAYLSKGGLALLFFIPLFIAMIFAIKNTTPSSTTLRIKSDVGGRYRGVILDFLYAGLAMLIIIFPEKIILALLYPAEFYFEQSLQALHLFKDLEYWGRPWDYYWSVYFRDMILPYVYAPAFLSLFFGISRIKKDLKIFVLAVWALSFMLTLSFGITKIANFILPALPAILLLLAIMFKWLGQNQKNSALASFSSVVILSYIVIRLDLWRVKYNWFQDQMLFQRFAVFVYTCLGVAALWVIFRILSEQTNLKNLARILAIVAWILVIGTYARANQLADKKIAKDAISQSKIKTLALEIKNKYPKRSIFLINYPKLPKNHLYFKYWSDYDALEIYNRQPVYYLEANLPKNTPAFVLSSGLMERKELKLEKKFNDGYLYKINP